MKEYQTEMTDKQADNQPTFRHRRSIRQRRQKDKQKNSQHSDIERENKIDGELIWQRIRKATKRQA